MTGSNSNNNRNNNVAPSPAVVVTPAAPDTTALDVFVTPNNPNTMKPEHNATSATQASKRSISCTLNFYAGPSTKAEIDAIKVTKIKC
jgi:hypothetical protein